MRMRLKKKRSRKKKIENLCYAIQINGWEWSFHFGVNKSRHDDDPYKDYRHLNIKGTLLLPVGASAQEGELVLIPAHYLNEDKRQPHQPKAIGTFRMGDGKFEGILSIPFDALEPTLAMLIGNKFRFAVLESETLYRREAPIYDICIQMDLTEDSLPVGDWEKIPEYVRKAIAAAQSPP